MPKDSPRQMTSEDVDRLLSFIRETSDRIGYKGVVIGLSGGLDSAVTTKLCVDALGPDRVLNVFMPTHVTPTDEYTNTMNLSKLWKTDYKMIDIQPVVEVFTATLFSNVKMPLERGNISARCRMVVLYNLAKKLNYIVVGTSNKSEYMMGYFTKYGDGACDISPTMDLYKTQIRQIAKLIDVPQEIIDKVPTAGLWEGQTDEEEMGISYVNLDLTLYMMSNGKDDKEISEILNIDIKKISEIRLNVSKMEHKRFPAINPDSLLDT